MSLVILVISVEIPTVSISVKESDSICLKSPCLKFVAKPTAAFAAKYCAVIELKSPTAAKITRIPPYTRIKCESFFAIPSSIIFAMTIGTVRSKQASNSLNKGPSTHSFW